MHREGHVGAALFAYAPLGFLALATGYERVALVGAVAAAGLVMLPDYDQRVPGISHRGVTHTVWFAAVVGVLLGMLGAVAGHNGAGVVAGVGLGLFGASVGTLTILSHVAADALTPMGVEPFAPVRDDHYTYDVATAANPVANYALLVLGLAAAGIALWAGTNVPL